MTAEPRTEWTRKLSTGQTLVISLNEDGKVDFNIEFDKGESSVLTIRARLEEMMPFIASTAREIAASTGLEVAYAWRLGDRLQHLKVSPAGRVAPISEHSTDRFRAFIQPL